MNCTLGLKGIISSQSTGHGIIMCANFRLTQWLKIPHSIFHSLCSSKTRTPIPCPGRDDIPPFNCTVKNTKEGLRLHHKDLAVRARFATRSINAVFLIVFRRTWLCDWNFLSWPIDEFQINEINVDLRTSGFDNEVLSVDACAVWWERE